MWLLATTHCVFCKAQTIYQYESPDARICFFQKSQSQYIPHLIRRYELGKQLHSQIWGALPSQIPFMWLTDWEDDGNGGVCAMPHTMIQIGMAPMNKSYFVAPAGDRYAQLFKHEYTHVVMTDKANSEDEKWRRFTGNKVVPDSKYPLSSVWGYLNVPRWYSPRWYHEGIACFLETWLGDGFGRALGGYDETYFRTQIKEGKELFSVVGLETEGNTSDFQQGSVSYLYGTRFVNYLVLTYGYEKLVEFYNRTDDSEKFYADQFEKVYGRKLREVWGDWIKFEKVHQEENLGIIAEYPLTELDKITDICLGAASPMIVDEERKVAYAAVNHAGDFAHIARIDLSSDSNNISRIAPVLGAQMYQTAYLAYDRNRQRLIWTDRNSKWRGLTVYDLGEKKQTKHLKYQRVNNICYDNAGDCLYGIISNGGTNSLVKYDANLENPEFVFSFPFGVSVGDLDVSHDGKHLVASMLGTRGQHSLIMFDTMDFEDGIFDYRTLMTLDDSNLSQFRFSADDSKLVGFSYYTGVPNIWSLDPETGDFELLSNVETGMFAPYLASDGTVYAYHFTSEGMDPVKMEYRELKDANSIQFLGQKAYEANPRLAEISTPAQKLPELSYGEIYDSVKIYNPVKELKFQGAYPDISGFTDRNSFNNVTPVLGYHFSFYDPLSAFRINCFVGASPWSTNDWKNRVHASADVKYYNWTFNAAWNPCCFYDLFGPRRASRKGYSFSLAYNRNHTMQLPFRWSWGAAIAHYGDMDALPLYQEISVDENITSFQTVNVHINGGRVNGTLGAISGESGYRFAASAYSYIANGKLFPSIDASGEIGTRLPFGEHNAFWAKGAVGQSFGDPASALGNSYFGGFRNNYVDNGEINRFSTVSALPGARIDQIKAHNYAKLTGEIDFTPIRLNDFGALQCYPNYIQFCLFGHDLMTDQWGSRSGDRANYVSVGAQMNIQLVFFSYLKSTLSVGYARTWGNAINQGEFMISLKLL